MTEMIRPEETDLPSGAEDTTKQTILIVDDSMINRALLSSILGDTYDILEAVDGEEAVAILSTRLHDISIVILDIVMPKMDGFEVLAVMNREEWIKEVPVITISSETSSSYINRAYELGVTDFITRPFDANIVQRRVANTIMLYAKQRRLVDMVSEQIFEKEKNSSIMVAILSHIVEFRNGESGLHVLHVNSLTEIMLRAVMRKTDKYGITADDVPVIVAASSLHDIGKIAIDDKILNKPGRFTDEEFEEMKKHSAYGSDMLDALPFHQDEPIVKYSREIARWHHERWDGRGYPDGLVGDDIPISAQIVAMADVYDALTSDRVYKKAYSHEKSMEMILNGECGTFNPLLLECLQESAEDIQRELKVNSVTRNTQRAMGKIVDEVNRNSDLSSTGMMLNLLNHERMKYSFFSSLVGLMSFDYVVASGALALSDAASTRLGLPETITNVRESEDLKQVFSEDLIDLLSAALEKTTPQDSDVALETTVVVNGTPTASKLICRSVWANLEDENCSNIIAVLIPDCDDASAYAQSVLGTF